MGVHVTLPFPGAAAWVQVSDPGSTTPRTLYGVCCLQRELVHRPPAIARGAFPTCTAPLSRYLVAGPRCYVLLTHYPFFALHFRVGGALASHLPHSLFFANLGLSWQGKRSVRMGCWQLGLRTSSCRPPPSFSAQVLLTLLGLERLDRMTAFSEEIATLGLPSPMPSRLPTVERCGSDGAVTTVRALGAVALVLMVGGMVISSPRWRP